MFGLRSRKTIGLDIGSSSIKVVQLKDVPEGLELEAAGIVANPIFGLKDEEVENVGSIMAATIKDLLSENNIKGMNVVSSISGPDVSIQYFEFPRLSPEELRGAVMLEAGEVIPNIENMDMDFQVLSDEGEEASERMKVLCAAVPKAVSEQRIRVIEQTGLNPVIVDIDSLAIINCFLELVGEAFADQILIILNVGACITNLGILQKGKLQFIRDISFGGDDITTAIKRERKISLEEAEHLKKTPALRDEQDIDMLDTLTKRLGKFMREIKSSSEYYLTRAPVNKIDRVLLMGGGSKLAPLAQFISEGVNVPVSQWNPLEHLELDEEKFGPQFREEIGPTLAVAIGLALRKA
jgi:type IV pilus assembly protein PilM